MTRKIELSEFKEGLAKKAFTRRDIHKALMAVGVGVLTLPYVRPAAAAPSISIATWEAYSSPDLHKKFIETQGGSPAVQLFADNEEALQRMRAGALPTLAQPGSAILNRFHDAGLLAPIDVSKIPNYADVFPQLKTLRGMKVGDDVLAVAAAWGDSSVVYRRDLAPEYVENQSWNILWDPKYSGRLAQRDAMDSVTVVAALVLGIADPYTMSDADLAKIRAKLVEQRPLLRFYWTNDTDMQQAMASGEIVAAYGWNSSYSTLKSQGVDVGYMTPKEGRLTWVDVTVRIKGGPGSEDEALAYIDAFISAESGKVLIDKLGYGSPNAKAYAIADTARLKELGIDDPDKVLKGGRFYEEFTPEASAKVNAMYEEVKAGI